MAAITRQRNLTPAAFIHHRQDVVFAPLKGIHIIGCEYRRALYRRPLFAEMGIHFPASLNRAIPTRQAEFLAGRYMAQQALLAAGHKAVDIGIGPNRTPLWPARVCGTISHTDTHAFAAVANHETCQYIGIDAEHIIDPAQHPAVMSAVLSPQELGLLASAGFAPAAATTLGFSIKESFFKALYPCVQIYFDFQDIEITAIDTTDNTVEMTVINRIAPPLLPGKVFGGHYRAFDTGYLTLVIITPSFVCA